MRRLILSGLAMVVAFDVPASPASALTKAQCTSYVNNYQAKSPVSGSGEMLATAAFSAAPVSPTACPG